MNEELIRRGTEVFEGLLASSDVNAAFEGRILLLIGEGWDKDDLVKVLTPLLPEEEGEQYEIVMLFLDRIVGFIRQDLRFLADES